MRLSFYLAATMSAMAAQSYTAKAIHLESFDQQNSDLYPTLAQEDVHDELTLS